MPRRRKHRGDLEIMELIFKLVALLFFLSLFSPAVRQGLTAVGLFAFLIFGLALVAGVGFLIYRFVVRRRRSDQDAVALRVFDLNRPDPQVVVPPARPATRLRVDVPESVRREARTPDLLERLNKIDWFQFEKIVALTYRKLGYSVTRRGGANPDGGIDLIIEKNGQRAGVQCKQWKTWNVGVKAVREFLGALTHAGIQKGIFITLRGYSGEAKLLAQDHGIEMLNETDLAVLLEKTDAGFDPEALDVLSDTRKFCPKCEREMVLKTARKGKGAGQQFWACPGYPWKCRYTMPVDQG
jgi:Restriction endonuclease